MSESDLPVSIIRGGTSRGIFLRASDLPADPSTRGERILRLFGSAGGILADGLGGEHPVLRKAAIVEPAPPADDGLPRVRYTFGQIEPDLRTIRHTAECGNVAAGVPAFGLAQGWVPSPKASTRLRIDLTNTGLTVIAEWLHPCTPREGTVRLGFVTPAPSHDAALLSPTAATRVTTINGTVVRYSAVRAVNDYLFVDSRSFGLERPTEVHDLGATIFQTLCDLVGEAQTELECGALKVCLVAPAPHDGAIAALIVYPAERRLHGSFAVTGAVALGVASRLSGTVAHEMARVSGRSQLDIVHRSGVLPVTLQPAGEDAPEVVGVERTFRVLMRGVAP